MLTSVLHKGWATHDMYNTGKHNMFTAVHYLTCPRATHDMWTSVKHALYKSVHADNSATHGWQHMTCRLQCNT